MENKRHLAALRKNYVKAPNSIFDLGLSATALSIYFYMASCSEQFNPAVLTIAKKVNISRNTVRKHLDELIEANVIQITHAPYFNKSTKYRFTSPNEWIKKESTSKVLLDNNNL